MATRKSHMWLGAAAILFAALPSFAVSDAERLEVYKEFLSNFQAKQYAEAQPLAEKLVTMTETQYGPEELQLITPLANLATVHLPAVSSLVGPTHGCAYLFVVVLTARATRATRVRAMAVVPGIGGLLVLRELTRVRRG